MGNYAIGLDFGTLSVRALLLEVSTGRELFSSVYEYPHGVLEERLPSGQRIPTGFALQDPDDYLEGFFTTVQKVLSLAKLQPEEIIGLGIDFTSSTVLPTTADGTPLCHMPEFRQEPHAYVKLWKHHGGTGESRRIEEAAGERREEWLSFYGGKVSGEWLLPKVLETLDQAPQVYEAADLFLEAMDWMILKLTGELVRSGCSAGYKAFYRRGTYPSDAFLREVDQRLEGLGSTRLRGPVKNVGQRAGTLTPKMARAAGLPAGLPVGVGIIDAHASLLGCGVTRPGILMVTVGTSSCHILLADRERAIKGMEVVKDGILPGFYAYEAGQSCVGICLPGSEKIVCRRITRGRRRKGGWRCFPCWRKSFGAVGRARAAFWPWTGTTAFVFR